MTIFSPCRPNSPSTFARFSGVTTRAKNPEGERPTCEPNRRPARKMRLSPARMPRNPTPIITGRLAAPLWARNPPRMREMSSGSGTPSPQARRMPKTLR